ncbi:MAG: response regulator [Bacteroidales bacterium]|nr:response regulator [Bacteroidales bacterium]
MEKKINILYVDDEQINLQLFSMLFEKKFNILTASSGNEGLNILAKKNNFSIVISDMKMPEMNGIEFIKKAREQYKNIRYFILTGFEITKEISEALKQKIICSYFKKPFIPTDIEEKINEVLYNKS